MQPLAQALDILQAEDKAYGLSPSRTVYAARQAKNETT